jgi:plasmid maintenance system antidote protein VapI
MHIKDPPHPGDFIRTEIIAPTGLSVTAAAAALRVFAADPVQFA